MLKYKQDKEFTYIYFPTIFRKFLQTLKKSLGSKYNSLILEVKLGYFTNSIYIKLYTNLELEFYAYINWLINNDKTRYPEIAKLVRELLEKESTIKNLLQKIPEHSYNRNLLEPLRFQPLEHQERYFKEYSVKKKLFNLNGVYLEGGVGVGKTFISLAQSLLLKSKVTIIVTPLNAKYKVWNNSLTVELFKRPQRVFNIPEDTIYKGEEYIVVHYQALDKLKEFITKHKLKDVMLIVDEAHNFNSKISKQKELLIDIIKSLKPDNIQLLSGTPIKADIKELDFTIQVLEGNLSSAIYKRINSFYRRPPGYAIESGRLRYAKYSIKIKKSDMKLVSYYEVEEPIKIEEPKPFYIETIREDMIRYSKQRLTEIEKSRKDTDREFLLLVKEYIQLAQKRGLVTNSETSKYYRDIEIVREFYSGKRKVENIPDIVRATNLFEKTLLSLMSGTTKSRFRELKSLYKYPILKVLGEALGRIVGRRRIEASKELATYVDYESILKTTDKKVILFSNYIESCRIAQDVLKSLKLKSVGVYGEFTKDLNTQVSHFTNDNSIRFLVATYKSLSTAVPLIMADRIIALDLPFRNYIWEQGRGRVWRLGQTSPVYAYKVFIDTGNIPNITTRTIDIMEFTREMAEYIIGYEVPVDEDIKDEAIKESLLYLESKDSLNKILTNLVNF